MENTKESVEQYSPSSMSTKLAGSSSLLNSEIEIEQPEIQRNRGSEINGREKKEKEKRKPEKDNPKKTKVFNIH